MPTIVHTYKFTTHVAATLSPEHKQKSDAGKRAVVDSGLLGANSTMLHNLAHPDAPATHTDVELVSVEHHD